MFKKLTLLCIAVLVSIAPIRALEADKQDDSDTLDLIMKAIVQNNNEYSEKVNGLIGKSNEDGSKLKVNRDEANPKTAKALEQYANIVKEELGKQAVAEAAAKKAEEKKATARYAVDRNSDLSNANVYVTVDDMNAIISHFDSSGTSPFRGQGAIFIEASQQSGLDPIYILAHASWESDWGRSYLARDRGNYFGINAIDANPNAAHHMGNTMYDGIVNGAVWISRHYYQEGQTSLNSMIYGPKRYAQAADAWINGINGIMSESYAVVRRSHGM